MQKKSAVKTVISELGKRVEKYDLINNLARGQVCITFGHIALKKIDSAKNELQRFLSRKVVRTVVNFAGKEKVHGLSMSRHLLVRVEKYSESTVELFYSGSVLNVMSHKMVKKLHLRMQTTNGPIKVANCASEKCVGTLNEVPISSEDLVVPMDFLIPEETLYDILISLPTMVQLRARSDY